MLKVQQNRRVLRALASGRIFPDTICSMPWQSTNADPLFSRDCHLKYHRSFFSLNCTLLGPLYIRNIISAIQLFQPLPPKQKKYMKIYKMELVQGNLNKNYFLLLVFLHYVFKHKIWKQISYHTDPYFLNTIFFYPNVFIWIIVYSLFPRSSGYFAHSLSTLNYFI